VRTSDSTLAVEALGDMVNYQPVIDLASGKVAKVDVLSRPDAPGQRIADMVKNAEVSGDIKRMAERVLDTALGEWSKSGPAGVALSVNLSLRNLDENDLAKRVSKALKKHRFDPKALWFEIDAEAQHINNGAWVEHMRELASIGVRFSIDSFGTDLSQATVYDLNRLPVAELKIDGPVVADCDGNMEHRGHITAAVQMARQLKLATAAKGIERAEIAALVTRLGCTYGQGYFFARPLPIATVVPAIDSFKSPLSNAPAQ